jgi:predicted  nucleic acid-binding Zn-ribbon protein
VTKRSVIANITGDSTLSLSGTLETGKEMSIKARNAGTAERTITLSNTTTWESKNTKGETIDSVKVPAGGAIEINIWALDKYIVKTDA